MGSVTGNRMQRMILTGALLTAIMVFRFHCVTFCDVAYVGKERAPALGGPVFLSLVRSRLFVTFGTFRASEVSPDE